MDFNDLYDAGSDILGAVTDAINTGDFRGLSEEIRRTVDEVTDTVREGIYGSTGDPTLRGRGSGTGGGNPYRSTGTGGNPYRTGASSGTGNTRSTSSGTGSGSSARTTSSRTGYGAAGTGHWDVREAREQGDNPYRRNSPYARQHASFASRLSPFLQRKISRLTGVGSMVTGGIGIAFGAAVLGIGGLALLLGAGSGALPGLIFGAAVAAGSGFLFNRGRKKKELVKRYYEYGAAVGDSEYIELKKLARATGRTEKEVRADIEKMIDENMLAQAWMDRSGTTLMLTEEMYSQYLAAEESRREREAQEAQTTQQMEADGISAEVRAILEEGKKYSQTIRECNDVIPDETMTEKLYRLEGTMNRILEQVRKQPESAKELRKLMSYYLPTTVKLLHAYMELDRQQHGGENITNTKREIEDALDTINQAFEQLLDSLFADMAWDVSTDISVMKTMFAQDGLSRDELQKELIKEKKRRAAAEAMAAREAVEGKKPETQQAAQQDTAAQGQTGAADGPEASQQKETMTAGGGSGSGGKAGSGWNTYDTGYSSSYGGGGAAYQEAPPAEKEADREKEELKKGPVLRWDE